MKKYECIEIPLYDNSFNSRLYRLFYANGFKAAKEWCKTPLSWSSNAKGWVGITATHEYMIRECR